MVFSSIVELKQDEFLYQAGDSGSMFWFVLTGKLEVSVKTDNEFKFSKNVDESTFFGKKQFFNETRGDYAKVVSAKALLLQFKTIKYNKIVSKTQISEGEKKINFLIRYVPGLRDLVRR